MENSLSKRVIRKAYTDAYWAAEKEPCLRLYLSFIEQINAIR